MDVEHNDLQLCWDCIVFKFRWKVHGPICLCPGTDILSYTLASSLISLSWSLMEYASQPRNQQTKLLKVNQIRYPLKNYICSFIYILICRFIFTYQFPLTIGILFLFLWPIKFNSRKLLLISCWKENPKSWECCIFQWQFISVYFWYRDILGARQVYTLLNCIWIVCYKLLHIMHSERTRCSLHFLFWAY